MFASKLNRIARGLIGIARLDAALVVLIVSHLMKTFGEQSRLLLQNPILFDLKLSFVPHRIYSKGPKVKRLI